MTARVFVVFAQRISLANVVNTLTSAGQTTAYATATVNANFSPEQNFQYALVERDITVFDANFRKIIQVLNTPKYL